MKPPANHIFEFTPETLSAWCKGVGMPAFRATQVLEWVYAKGVADPALMTNLSKRDRDLLADQMVFLTGRTVKHQVATDGTQKLLVQWEDRGVPVAEGLGALLDARGRPMTPGTVLDEDAAMPEGDAGGDIPLPQLGAGGGGGGGGGAGGARLDGGMDASRQTECVMIPTEDRHTACISSQIGCPVGCRFCASGLGGLDGNLSAGRIVEQVWRLGRLDGVPRISNVVFMGMGEPLSNLGNVVPAVRTLCALWGMGISARKITISTVGLPKAIDNLARELDLPVTLALSLHAPTDELRRRLIPWAEYTTIADLLGACRRWFDKTGREITLEYTLLRGVNDGAAEARELARLAKTLRANVNLIRYNEVRGLPFERPRTDDVRAFQEVLRQSGINAHIRASRGRDIAAACGQLRHEASGQKAPGQQASEKGSGGKGSAGAS